MVLGDFLILAVSCLFFYIAIALYVDFKKYISAESIQLTEICKFQLHKLYAMRYFTLVLGLFLMMVPFFALSSDPFYLYQCHGTRRCVEAHILSYSIFGASIFASGISILIFCGKKIKEVKKREGGKGVPFNE